MFLLVESKLEVPLQKVFKSSKSLQSNPLRSSFEVYLENVSNVPSI